MVIRTQDNKRVSFKRDFDSERKLIIAFLDKLNIHNLNAEQIQSLEVSISSERGFCASCAIVIKNFYNNIKKINSNFKVALRSLPHYKNSLKGGSRGKNQRNNYEFTEDIHLSLNHWKWNYLNKVINENN